MPVTSVQFGQTDWSYVNGLVISNHATTPNTKLSIASGSTLDSTGVYQMVASSALTIDATTTGLNGLDTGSLAASKVYAVFLVADPVTQQSIGAMISLSYTAPLLPFGYSVFKLIGYVVTDSSSHFLAGYWSGNNSAAGRQFTFDAPIATSITAGNATSYTVVDLSTFVPLVANTPVSVAYAFTPGAASRTLSLNGALSTGDAVTITGQVTSVVVSGNAQVLAQISSSKPEIAYKVSNSGDAVALKVAGYSWSV